MITGVSQEQEPKIFGDDPWALELMKNSSRQPSWLLSALGGALCAIVVATGAYHDIYNYISPTTAAIILFILLPRALRRFLLRALLVWSAASVAFHLLRQNPMKDDPAGTTTSKVALVTGASSGIGAEMAKELGRRGYSLVLVARREERLRELEEAIRNEGLPNDKPIHIIKADLSVPSEAARVHRTVTQDLGIQLSVLINNAGIAFTEDFIKFPPDKMDDILNLNIMGTSKLTRYFAADMAERGWGRIAVVSSIAGSSPCPHVAVYGASKAYLSSFTLALQHELEPLGVRVTLVVPGATITEFEKVSNAEGILAFQFPGMAMSARDVALEGIEGILSGRTMVVTGLLNKMYILATFVVPPKMLRWINETAWR